MKNLINYYYNLLITEFKKINESFIFEINGKKYEFIPFYGDVNKFYKNYLVLLNNNKYCHEVIFNKDKSILTFYDNKPYILLKKNISIDKCVDLNEIINYDISIYGQKAPNWKKLWKDKIDYYEYQMSQLAIKYKVLKNSFDYYIGLSETAINLLNYINADYVNFYISHNRINKNEKLDDFFNPINIVVDSRVRDIAEYIKINYFHNLIDTEEILSFLDGLEFDYTESILFLSRLLYPSYYFDVYDQIIQEKLNEDKIKFYIKKASSYEDFLKKIYNYIKNKYKIPQIEWLEF
ncbi:MAG: hypothetical protein E7310_08120 [Clostridiales bacterium]|nr:hypothetical protein [Clostridiales bacterium]